MSVTISGSFGSFTAEIGTTMPTLTDVGGGWNEIARPRRMAMTEWMGTPATKGTIQLLFDGFADDVSVQGDVEALVAAYAMPEGQNEPPPFSVTGAWPIPSTTQWVCNGVVWDDWIRNTSGVPVRVFMTLNLLEYVSPDVVTNGPGAAGGVAASSTTVGRTAGLSGAPGAGVNATAVAPATRTYTTKDGDSLSSIAASQLGNWRLGDQIATLNNIRDGNALPPGTVLRLP